MMRTFLFLLGLFLSVNVFAQTVVIEVDLQEFGDLVKLADSDDAQGWTQEKGEPARLKKTFTFDGPTSKDMFDYNISYFDGTVSVALNIGDADGGFNSKIALLKDEKGELIKTNSPYVLTASGGDYAGGSWTGEAKLSITVK